MPVVTRCVAAQRDSRSACHLACCGVVIVRCCRGESCCLATLFVRRDARCVAAQRITVHTSRCGVTVVCWCRDVVMRILLCRNGLRSVVCELRCAATRLVRREYRWPGGVVLVPILVW